MFGNSANVIGTITDGLNEINVPTNANGPININDILSLSIDSDVNYNITFTLSDTHSNTVTTTGSYGAFLYNMVTIFYNRTGTPININVNYNDGVGDTFDIIVCAPYSFSEFSFV